MIVCAALVQRIENIEYCTHIFHKPTEHKYN
jgi:hypothetical protein